MTDKVLTNDDIEMEELVLRESIVSATGLNEMSVQIGIKGEQIANLVDGRVRVVDQFAELKINIRQANQSGRTSDKGVEIHVFYSL